MCGKRKQNRMFYKGVIHSINMLGQKLEIKKTTDGKITFYKAIKVVKKMGNSGHVIIPKELIGKEVRIIWERKSK